MNCYGLYGTTQVGDPRARVVAKRVVTREFTAERSSSWGFHALVSRVVLKKLRGSGRDVSLCVGVTVFPT